MSRIVLVCLVGSTTAFFILIDLIISIALYQLHDLTSDDLIPIKWTGIGLTALNLILVGLLSYRLFLESETRVTEWRLGKVRARALFSILIFINIGTVSGETIWSLSAHRPETSRSDPRFTLTIAHGVVWAIAAYCQGFLCALSFVLSNILDNHSHRVSKLSIDTSRTADAALSTINFISPSPSPQWKGSSFSRTSSLFDPLPSPQSEMSVHTSILRTTSPAPDYRSLREMEPLYFHPPSSRTGSLRSNPSIDTVVRRPTLSDGKTHANTTDPFSASRESLLDNNIHPLFRPSSPHLPPTPNQATSIIAPLGSASDYFGDRAGADPNVSPEIPQPRLPGYVLNATARNSLLRYESSTAG
ncbi:uncharacterized protein ACLA_059330 [Aspergillus clavatus NRRL 1]|uniref:Uncharacterized protein n=1 Tax=Aspergillus clavatus (strain ATCC 1007 / CBS 513.65 / DSM 816 / NCTC 3887 / NRRL 1 / QM 1276 / 107) TaxID=344612 RepID=A1C4C9_ASPCL|nr:uncharacterized protein ACLA_059330 [Aspergillus clavatus NRRL 1]EAW15269.1 conserved hypothetical protein [Aspergillus clavatus NRRL 1]